MTRECGIKSEKTEKEKNFVPLCLGGEKPEPGRIYLTPKIKSYYYCRNTLKGLWDQNFKNGQWVVYTKYIAPYALSLRHFIPLAFVSTILLLIIASLTSGTGLKSLMGSTGLNILSLVVKNQKKKKMICGNLRNLRIVKSLARYI